MRSDPNGHPWLDWKKYGYASHEAFIESKAGDSPPDPDPLIPASIWREEDDFPMPEPPPFAADDEDDEAPDA